MVSLAMILHDHGSLGKILARSCQDLGKHTHASWQACQDSCHWDNTTCGSTFKIYKVIIFTIEQNNFSFIGFICSVVFSLRELFSVGPFGNCPGQSVSSRHTRQPGTREASFVQFLHLLVNTKHKFNATRMIALSLTEKS